MQQENLQIWGRRSCNTFECWHCVIAIHILAVWVPDGLDHADISSLHKPPLAGKGNANGSSLG